MSDDPGAALPRQQRREDSRRRRESLREDLFYAARTLTPEYGIAIALSRIAINAGLPRHVAAGLFNGTADLATALVRRAWRALIEPTAPKPGATPQAFIAGLIRGIRADAQAHHIRQELACGAAQWQRAALAEDESFLAFALSESLRETWPALGAPDLKRRLGRRLLALWRPPTSPNHLNHYPRRLRNLRPASLCGQNRQSRAPRQRKAVAVAQRQATLQCQRPEHAGLVGQSRIGRNHPDRQRSQHRFDVRLRGALLGVIADARGQVHRTEPGAIKRRLDPLTARLAQQQCKQDRGVQRDACHSASASRLRSARKSSTDTPAFPSTSFRLSACALRHHLIERAQHDRIPGVLDNRLAALRKPVLLRSSAGRLADRWA